MRGTQPDDIDLIVAARLKDRRLALNLDSRLVDAAIGEIPGTVERFETCRRRIGAAHLFKLAVVLGTDVSYFFTGDVDAGVADAEHAPEPSSDPRQATEAQRFARAFASIDDEELRDSIRALVASLAGDLPDTAADVIGGVPIAPWPKSDEDGSDAEDDE